MLTPSTANKVTLFYAFGNTPADNLVRTLPQGVDARLLLLGCGDFRNILYTAYSEQGLPSRKLDFTCCDIVPEIHVRNALFFSFLVDGLVKDHQLDQLWDIYYNMYLDTEAMDFLTAQAKKLVQASESLEKWRASSYGRHLRFSDLATFVDFQKGLAALEKATAQKDSSEYQKNFDTAKAYSTQMRSEALGPDAAVMTGKRGVSPLVPDLDELANSFNHYYEYGTMAPPAPASSKTYANPTLATTMSETLLLHYTANPIDGYHLATAYAKLTEVSPLKVDEAVEGAFPRVKAARTEFRAMANAFKAIRSSIVIRFVTSDALVFCHTLQNFVASESKELTAQWHRKLFDRQILQLDPNEYLGAKGRKKAAPVLFDVIDASNLADHFGTLNLLVAAVPLLSNNPYASVLVELLLQREASLKETFNSLLCGHTATMALLLGVIPAEYISNATTTYGIDEYMFSLVEGNSQQMRSRVTWKRNDHFSGQQPRGNHRQTLLNIEPDDLVSILMQAYRTMFYYESPQTTVGHHTTQSLNRMQRNSSYPRFHRGSLAALLRVVKDRVQTDWDGMCAKLVASIYRDQEISLGSNHAQDLAVHLHMWDVYSEPWLKSDAKGSSITADFINAWSSSSSSSSGSGSGDFRLPDVVAVTFVIPRAPLARLYGPDIPKVASPTFEIGFRSAQKDATAAATAAAATGYHNLFSDVHFTYGTIEALGSRGSPDFVVQVTEDPLGWQGSSPLVASLYVPTVLLQAMAPQDTICLELHANSQSSSVYMNHFDRRFGVYHTTIGDKSRVYVSKFMPGQTGFPIVRPPATATATAEETTASEETHESQPRARITLNSDHDAGKVTSLTGRVSIDTERGKKLLVDKKTEIKLAKPLPGPGWSSSVFGIDVVFGKQRSLVLPVQFPVPVVFEVSRLRVARKSSWVEVVAQVAEPVKAVALEELVYPVVVLDHATQDTKFQPPVLLTIPTINLDTLPILDVSNRKELPWLTTLASFMFSARERKLRETVQSRSSTGLSSNPRLNFKESLFTMFMLASGLQGGQTGFFVVHHPDKGGVHMLIVVSALRLDSPNASVVADAAVIPLTNENIQDEDLKGFLALAQGLEMCKLNVDDGELELWKKSLPALAERCRTWSHDEATCEYARGGSVPVSLEAGKPVLCHCGQGKLPDNFIAVPYWEDAVAHATRIAISPLFCSSFVEEPFDVDQLKKDTNLGGDGGVTTATAAAAAAAATTTTTTTTTTTQYTEVGDDGGNRNNDRSPLDHKDAYRDLLDALTDHEVCRHCGATEAKRAGGPLKRCMRCREAKYCSAECQRKDWRKHRMECKQEDD